MSQLLLDDIQALPRELTITERAQAFHRANPQVMDRVRDIVQRLHERGFQHYGMKAIFEELRHDPEFKTHTGEAYKMNNDFTSWYAREFIRQYPLYSGFFELRQRKG